MSVHSSIHSKLHSIPADYACMLTIGHYALYKELKASWAVHRDTCTDNVIKKSVDQRFDELQIWMSCWDCDDCTSVASDDYDSE